MKKLLVCILCVLMAHFVTAQSKPENKYYLINEFGEKILKIDFKKDSILYSSYYKNKSPTIYSRNPFRFDNDNWKKQVDSILSGGYRNYIQYVNDTTYIVIFRGRCSVLD